MLNVYLGVEMLTSISTIESLLETWQQLEDEMRRRYMEEMRQIEDLQMLEDADTGAREFYVESTG